MPGPGAEAVQRQQVREGGQGGQPLVALGFGGAQQGGAAARAQCGGDVGEGGGGVAEEHDAEAADDDIERAAGERVDLGVALFESDVGEVCALGAGSGALEHRAGQVQAQGTAVRGGGASGEQGRGSRAAADVEDVVAGRDDRGVEQGLVEPAFTASQRS